jgi:hypothetical protein
MILVHIVVVRQKMPFHRIGFQCILVVIVIQNIVKTMVPHVLSAVLLITVKMIKYMRN